MNSKAPKLIVEVKLHESNVSFRPVVNNTEDLAKLTLELLKKIPHCSRDEYITKNSTTG
jgi:hypothetical protein